MCLYIVSIDKSKTSLHLLADDPHTCLMVSAAAELNTLKLNKSPHMHTLTHPSVALFKFVVHPGAVGVCGQLCLDICFSVSPEWTGVGVSSVQTRFCSCRARPHTHAHLPQLTDVATPPNKLYGARAVLTLNICPGGIALFGQGL